MPRLLGVDIPNDKKTVYSLQYLFGVGPKVARDLCIKAGIDQDKPARLAILNDQVGATQVAR